MKTISELQSLSDSELSRLLLEKEGWTVSRTNGLFLSKEWVLRRPEGDWFKDADSVTECWAFAPNVLADPVRIARLLDELKGYTLQLFPDHECKANWITFDEYGTPSLRMFDHNINGTSQSNTLYRAVAIAILLQ